MTVQWSDQLHQQQKDAIWRVLQDRTALLAHEVGFGKTAIMVAAGMELRRLGLASKNVYVLPKHTQGQFKEQFKEIYPYAKILFPTPDDFTGSKRGTFLAKATTGDWDAIIIKHEHIEQLIAEDSQIYGRFYQSLAEILSRRLRETTEKVAGDEDDDEWSTG